MADYSCEYLIVGGGPSGATIARELAKAGKDVILLEKDYKYTKPCGGGVLTKVFEEFDIPISLEINRVTKFNLFSPKLKKVAVNLDDTPISIVERKGFDSGLREQAEQSGAKLIEAKYKSMNFHENTIEVIIDENGSSKTINSHYLIAADGANSTVKKSLSIKSDSVITHYINVPDLEWESCDFYFGSKVAPHHYGWVFPHLGETNIGVAVDKESYIKPFSNMIVQNSIKVQGYPIPQWDGSLYLYEDRVFFVGDAAGQVLPFTYEGIYYAISSARILATALISGNPKSYQSLWEKRFKKRFVFFKNMQRLFLCCDSMAEWLIKLFAKERLQQKALKYWQGGTKPLSSWEILKKLPKLFFAR